MKRNSRYFISIAISIVLISSIAFGASPVTMNKAYNMLTNGDNCYVIGGFKLIHTVDPAVGDSEQINTGQNLNGTAIFHSRIELINTDTNKSYTFDVNPVTGSDSKWYYHDAKKLEKNDNEPYWVLSVPAGNYEVTDFTCTVTLTMPGYLPFSETWIKVPVVKLVKRDIKFSVQNKQLVYFGDYNFALASYICLNKQTKLYWPYKLTIDFKDNFDSVKQTLINGADSKTQEKMNNLEIISAL
jgi:hypothetical protein